MTTPLIIRVTLLTAAFFLAQPALAACTLESIKGRYAGEYFFPEDSAFWAVTGALMLRFDGQGGIKVIKDSEGSDGIYGTATGSGSYTLGHNCVGEGKLTTRSNGQLIDRGTFDFYVGGTKGRPEILGTYQSATTGQTGQLRLIKSTL